MSADVLTSSQCLEICYILD